MCGKCCVVTSAAPSVVTGRPSYALSTLGLGRVAVTMSAVINVRVAPVSNRPLHSLPLTVSVVLNTSACCGSLATYTVS